MSKFLSILFLAVFVMSGFAKTTTASTLTITSISPSTGAIAGGDDVYLSGTGFGCPNETVYFGDKKAQNWSQSQGVSIRASTPPSTAGTVDVTVTNDCGTVTVSGGFTYLPPVPTQKSQCKQNGWMIFTNPRFKNQGECLSFVGN